MIELLALVCALALLALGVAAGWFGHQRWGVGPPTPTEPEPEPLADAVFARMRAAQLEERRRQHAEWDAEWRKLTPPSPGVVWQRSVTGDMVKWPEFGHSPKGHKITDFNN